MLEMMLIFLKNYQSLICGPRCHLSWKTFHVHLRKNCNLLFLDEMSYIYQLGSSVQCSAWHLCFLINVLSGCTVHWFQWGVTIPHYYCVTVDFPFYRCKHLSYVLRYSYVGCVYIYIYTHTYTYTHTHTQVISHSWINPLIFT